MSNPSRDQSSQKELSHSDKISQTKITILENIEEFTRNYIDNNNNADPFNNDYFEKLKSIYNLIFR